MKFLWLLFAISYGGWWFREYKEEVTTTRTVREGGGSGSAPPMFDDDDAGLFDLSKFSTRKVGSKPETEQRCGQLLFWDIDRTFSMTPEGELNIYQGQRVHQLILESAKKGATEFVYWRTEEEAVIFLKLGSPPITLLGECSAQETTTEGGDSEEEHTALPAPPVMCDENCLQKVLDEVLRDSIGVSWHDTEKLKQVVRKLTNDRERLSEDLETLGAELADLEKEKQKLLNSLADLQSTEEVLSQAVSVLQPTLFFLLVVLLVLVCFIFCVSKGLESWKSKVREREDDVSFREKLVQEDERIAATNSPGLANVEKLQNYRNRFLKGRKEKKELKEENEMLAEELEAARQRTQGSPTLSCRAYSLN